MEDIRVSVQQLQSSVSETGTYFRVIIHRLVVCYLLVVYMLSAIKFCYVSILNHFLFHEPFPVSSN